MTTEPKPGSAASSLSELTPTNATRHSKPSISPRVQLRPSVIFEPWLIPLYKARVSRMLRSCSLVINGLKCDICATFLHTVPIKKQGDKGVTLSYHHTPPISLAVSITTPVRR